MLPRVSMASQMRQSRRYAKPFNYRNRAIVSNRQHEMLTSCGIEIGRQTIERQPASVIYFELAPPSSIAMPTKLIKYYGESGTYDDIIEMLLIAIINMRIAISWKLCESNRGEAGRLWRALQWTGEAKGRRHAIYACSPARRISF